VTKAGIEAIKGANELCALLAERGIELKKKGRTLVARCPFHQEKTASFTVTPSKGLYHCFGCGAAGDVIGFLTKRDKLSFGGALELLAKRAGLDLEKLMEERSRVVQRTPLEALTPAPLRATAASGNGDGSSAGSAEAQTLSPAVSAELLTRVVEHYHRTFCAREDAQAYLKKRGLVDVVLLRALKVGYADGSLLKLIPRSGELRQQLVELGVITSEGRELLGGCVVFPIPDPLSGQWTTLYGRGVKTERHCYLPGALRGVWNFQAARLSDEVVLCESVIDALSFHQAGLSSAIPIYGTNGFTGDHLDLFKREGVKQVTLALDNDDAGRKAAAALREKLEAAGLRVRVASWPSGVKDANELLVSRNGDAGDIFRQVLEAAEPRPQPAPNSPHPIPLTQAGEGSGPAPAGSATREESGSSHLSEKTAASGPAIDEPMSAVNATSATPATSNAAASAPALAGGVTREGEQLVLVRDGVTYRARAQAPMLGRLRATVKAERGAAFHVDSIDLYASRSRSEFAKRAAKALSVDVAVVESALLQLLVEAEKIADTDAATVEASSTPTMSESERAEALALLKREDLLDQIARDVDALGYVGEDINKRLLYLVAVSRKLDDPLSAIVLSQSGAGKSGLTEVVERLTPPEDVVLLTRLTPQSLYYTEPGFLDRKLVIVEERYGSQEADYSIRVLQSRKKLIAAAPIKDPQTGNLRTKVFTVEARAAFIEATTASSVNHENATRCFELSMDESPEQTQRIHERQRRLKTAAGLELRRQAEAIQHRHWNAQRLLDPLPVVIPFAEALTFPTAWMRTRRDHARFLNLIEVSAFLHQHQRARSGGAIVADVADYAAAYRLAAEVLAETLSDLKAPLRRALERLRALSQQTDGTLSRREVREHLAEPDSTVRRWLSDLVELEYLAVAEAGRQGQGHTTRYRVLERAGKAEHVLGLLRPEELHARR
jgi:DNA primase